LPGHGSTFNVTLVSDLNPSYLRSDAYKELATRTTTIAARDATKPESYEGIDIACIIAPYGRGASDTKALCDSIKDALKGSPGVKYIIVGCRHQEGGPLQFGQPELYSSLLTNFEVLCTMRPTDKGSLVPGYRHYFTAKEPKEDQLLYNTYMYAVLLRNSPNWSSERFTLSPMTVKWPASAMVQCIVVMEQKNVSFEDAVELLHTPVSVPRSKVAPASPRKEELQDLEDALRQSAASRNFTPKEPPKAVTGSLPASSVTPLEASSASSGPSLKRHNELLCEALGLADLIGHAEGGSRQRVSELPFDQRGDGREGSTATQSPPAHPTTVLLEPASEIDKAAARRNAEDSTRGRGLNMDEEIAWGCAMEQPACAVEKAAVPSSLGMR
jgi:hypothetical protein